MNPAPQTAAPPVSAPSVAGAPRDRESFPQRTRRVLATRPYMRHLGLPIAMAVAAVMCTHKLAQNGYANIFYSAGVSSMERSLHNFLFVSFDPGGLVSVDKPPLALWVQATSARLFGFSPLSLLVPEAIAGVLAVALLYVMLARRLGPVAATAGALALAVYPTFVAVSRDNGVDPLLILLLVAACSVGLRASETGRWRTLLGCAVIVGLAFNVKTLAAYLVVPGIAIAYLVCAPGSPARRAGQLLVAGLVMAAVSFAWIAFVDATPASKRPYVGSSTNNSELGLTFGYNGLGRVEGQIGGPNQSLVLPGAYVPAARQRAVNTAAARAAAGAGAATGAGEHGAPGTSSLPAARAAAPAAAVTAPSVSQPSTVREPAPSVNNGREKYPIPFGGPPRLARLFGVGLGDQVAWLLPFALFGLIGMAILALGELAAERRREASSTPAETSTRSPTSARSRLATLLILGGWFAVEAVVLSVSKGIVHPYYVSALAPGVAAMAGAGAVAFFELARGRRRIWALVLVPCAVAGTVATQVVLLNREQYMQWFIPVLVVGAALAVCALLALRRLAAPALALAFALLLVAPAAYATTTWLAPVEGTFPVAGAKHFAGDGGYGVNRRDQAIDRALLDYVSTHRPGSRWALLTVASDTAAPIMLMGLDAGALGGYSGTDPALDGPGLARLVAAGQARYVLLGGEYSLRGGNDATKAVLRACRELAPWEWNSPVRYPFGLVLFDCAGREKALAAG
jgi:4-amino-4-deoxy-L-arabinose transferase-like glycosyltransferase